MRAITVENISFAYLEEKVLENLNFEIEAGEFIAILGPNGAGKTTLLKLLIGLLKPTSGRILVFGHDPVLEREKVLKITGYLPQKENLSVDMPLTVGQVMMLPLLSKNAKVDVRKLRGLLKLVGMDNKWDERFSDLSGGQQQRVLIARTLVNNPKLLLLDEPFTGIDIPSQERILHLLTKLKKKGITVVTVVHNVNLLLHDLDRIMLLNRKLVAFGRPDEIFTNENLIKTYGTSIPLVVCDEGYIHPLYGDYYG